MEIKKITQNKNRYMDILLLADPSEKAVGKYLEDSELFVMLDADKPVCAAAVVRKSQDTCELKNIAAIKLRKGFGTKMLLWLFDYYKNLFVFMEVGTGNSSTQNIKFYEKNGFDITHTIKNFFIDNYDEPIYENGVQCEHMIMMRKQL